MEERVFAQFKAAIEVENDIERSQLVYGDYPGWDSVAHMSLIAALETEFDCMLEMDDILDMSSFDKAIEIMSKYV